MERQPEVAEREPHLRQDERRRQEARSPTSPRRPRTSGTIGISQIRNCGDSTLPSATNAQRAAAVERTSASRSPRPRANDAQIQPSTPTCRSGGRDRKHAGRRPGEVLGAVAGLARQAEPEHVVADEQERRAEALDLQRPAQLDAEAVPDTVRATGSRTAGRSRRQRQRRARDRSVPPAGLRASTRTPHRAERTPRERASP